MTFLLIYKVTKFSYLILQVHNPRKLHLYPVGLILPIELQCLDDRILCNRLHADEIEPELMYQDFEHYPEQWYCEGSMGESTFDKIKEYAAHGEERREAYEAYLSYWDEGTLENFEERYEGKYNSPEDFAENLCEECGYFKNLPQWLQCCIDYSAVAFYGVPDGR
ncbi:MAG: antirestriction protein ArdA [Paludibacteraceae bacterium]|nr:antirestriction protein ArdA [Paludibacteraceae bacterium]